MNKIICLMLILAFLVSCAGPVQIGEDEQNIPTNNYITVERDGVVQKVKETKINDDLTETIASNTQETTLITKDTTSLNTQDTIQTKTKDTNSLKTIKEFLKTVPSKYWYHDIDKEIGAIVVGENKMDAWRFVGNHIEPGLYYWDYPKTNDLYIFYDEISTYQFYKEVKEQKESLPPVDEYKLAFVQMKIKDKYQYPKSPIDWMNEYKDLAPYKIDETRQAIKIQEKVFTSKLAMHYLDAAGTETIFRFDDKYKVPLVIEKRIDSRIIEQYRYYFDVNMYDISNWRITAEITDDLATLPANSIILTLDEAEKMNDLKPSYIRKRISMKARVIEIMEDFQGKTTEPLKSSI